ncbi:hypothetical protein AYI68_g1859 [Smittium mucronatum]|uniref:Uncharacterized protein n=1 Tax=Smittium mucronatum TaxID=133383 RepID=A0A1R0H497_9FUNG|nr:hypothetical protein AYI68_g1859 [Smittium mucronatum]
MIVSPIYSSHIVKLNRIANYILKDGAIGGTFIAMVVVSFDNKYNEGFFLFDCLTIGSHYIFGRNPKSVRTDRITILDFLAEPFRNNSLTLPMPKLCLTPIYMLFEDNIEPKMKAI